MRRLLIGVALSTACATSLASLRPTRATTPPGMPERGWRLCWDLVDDAMATSSSARALGAPRRECLRVRLLQTCGEWLEGTPGMWEQLHGADEQPKDFSCFDDWMTDQFERCEEGGHFTDDVKDLANALDDVIKEGVCPTP